VSEARLRLTLGAPDGARGVVRPPGGWPLLDGEVTETVRGPFLGLEGPGYEKIWYVVRLDTPLPAHFDPLHTLRVPLEGPTTHVLLRPDLVDPPPPDELRVLPDDVIGAALAQDGRARVSLYAGANPASLPDPLTLAALRAGPLRWLCSAWVEPPPPTRVEKPGKSVRDDLC
jgi:hypothetical protein